nr:DNA-processing protein DprA [Mobilicoccus caccae]
MAWSVLAEPGDPVASRLVRELGPVEALEALTIRAESSLDRFRPRLAQLDLDQVLDDAAGCGARLVTPDDREWPAGLDVLDAPPLLLWVRGPLDLAAATRRSVAVVGARAATAYGEHVAADIGAGLADRRVTVVSGGAFGIDAAAHRGVLAVEGQTVAVLAGGVDRPYPAAHHRLLGHIADVGALVSEMPPGSASLKSRFLLRNRLIDLSVGERCVYTHVVAGQTAKCVRDMCRSPGAVRRNGPGVGRRFCWPQALRQPGLAAHRQQVSGWRVEGSACCLASGPRDVRGRSVVVGDDCGADVRLSLSEQLRVVAVLIRIEVPEDEIDESPHVYRGDACDTACGGVDGEVGSRVPGFGCGWVVVEPNR